MNEVLTLQNNHSTRKRKGEREKREKILNEEKKVKSGHLYMLFIIVPTLLYICL